MAFNQCGRARWGSVPISFTTCVRRRWETESLDFLFKLRWEDERLALIEPVWSSDAMTRGTCEIVPLPAPAELFYSFAREFFLRSEEERQRVRAGFLVAMEYVDKNRFAGRLNGVKLVTRVVSMSAAEKRIPRDAMARVADSSDGASISTA